MFRLFKKLRAVKIGFYSVFKIDHAFSVNVKKQNAANS